MKTFRAMLVRFAGLFRRKHHEVEMSAELRAHLDALTERNVATGMSRDEARYAAQRTFGGVAQIAERARDERRNAWGEHLMQDLRYAARQFRKSPRFSAVVVLTLALGIGANTAVFSVIDALVLRPLPVRAPDELVFVDVLRSDGRRWIFGIHYSVYTEIRDRSRLLGGIVASASQGHALVASGFGDREIEPVRAHEVSGNFFQVLGVPASLGRTLSPADDAVENPQPVVVLSHSFWQRRFGANPSVLGKTILLDHTIFTIVGVAAPGFVGIDTLEPAEMWFPLHMIPAMGLDHRLDRSGLRIIARLRPDVARDAARTEIEGICQSVESYGFRHSRTAEAVLPGQQVFSFRIDFRPARAGERGLALRSTPNHPLFVLMAAAALVLLIACANLAGLLLARGAVRQRELAVRAALGASRSRLFRQLLAESVLLALAGGVGGVILAQGGTAWLAAYLPGESTYLDLRPNVGVLLFTVLLSAMAAVLFGLAPALRLSRLDLLSALKNQAASIAGRSRPLLNHALVVAQITLSIGLLVAASLFLRSLQKLRKVDAGFTRENVLLFTIRFDTGYDAARRTRLVKDVVARVEALPGVRRATFSSAGLLSHGGTASGFGVEGYTPRPGERMNAWVMSVGPGFFETLGIPLLRGRGPGAAEIHYPAAPQPALDRSVVVIGESLARRFFGEQDPIGRHILLEKPAEIIGVAKDTKYFGLRKEAVVDLYHPNFQGLGERRFAHMNFQVRTSAHPSAVASGLRGALHEIDPSLWVGEVRTMEDVIDENLKPERQLAQLAGFFSIVALTLACLGLYGVLAYNVAQRTREIGVRIALGADVRAILLLVMSQALRLTLVGCALGLAGALVVTRLVASHFFGVTATDPLSYAAVILLLLVVTMLAAVLPARRAAKVDPMVALRSE